MNPMRVCPRAALSADRTADSGAGRGRQTGPRAAPRVEAGRHAVRAAGRARQKLIAWRSPLTLKRFPWPWRIATFGQSICGLGGVGAQRG